MSKDEEKEHQIGAARFDYRPKINFGRYFRVIIIAQCEERERGEGVKNRQWRSEASRRPRTPVIFRERHTTGALLRQTHGTCCCRVYGVFTSDVTATPEYGGWTHPSRRNDILSSLPTPMRGKKRDGARSRKCEREDGVYRPFLSHAETTCRIMTLIIAEINLPEHCFKDSKILNETEHFWSHALGKNAQDF